MLNEIAAADPGMNFLTVDMQDPAFIRECAAPAAKEFPTLNVLINTGGIMRSEKSLAQKLDLADAEAVIACNLLDPIRLTAAFLPRLQKQSRATIGCTDHSVGASILRTT